MVELKKNLKACCVLMTTILLIAPTITIAAPSTDTSTQKIVNGGKGGLIEGIAGDTIEIPYGTVLPPEMEYTFTYKYDGLPWDGEYIYVDQVGKFKTTEINTLIITGESQYIGSSTDVIVETPDILKNASELSSPMVYYIIVPAQIKTIDDKYVFEGNKGDVIDYVLDNTKNFRTVNITLASGYKTTMDVDWDFSGYDPYADTQTFEGELSMRHPGIVNNNNLKVEMTINLSGDGDAISTATPNTSVIEFLNAIYRIPYTLPVAEDIDWDDVIFDLDDNIIIEAKLAETKDQYGVVVKNNVKEKVIVSKLIEPKVKGEVSFTDLQQTHWAYDSVHELCNRGYVQGDVNNKFRPKDVVTLAEACTFIDRVVVNNGVLTMRNPRFEVSEFVPESEHWAYDSVASIYSKLILDKAQKVNADTYNKELTRLDLTEILDQVLSNHGVSIGPNHVEYADWHLIQEADKMNEVLYCTSLGLLSGDLNNNFNPYKKVTRAELMAIILRLDDFLSTY